MDIKRNPRMDAPIDEQWILRNDDASVVYFPTEQEAKTAMAISTISEQPIELELAKTVIEDVLPPLRTLYMRMVALKVQWYDEDFQALLKDAAANGTTVAGFSADTWNSWGASLLLLEQFLGTKQDALNGATVLSILTRRYQAKE